MMQPRERVLKSVVVTRKDDEINLPSPRLSVNLLLLEFQAIHTGGLTNNEMGHLTRGEIQSLASPREFLVPRNEKMPAFKTIYPLFQVIRIPYRFCFLRAAHQ
jgi:hypothetical protein